MVYDFNTNQIDNFAWASLIGPISNLLNGGLGKINDTKHSIENMWKEYQDTKQAQAQALALQKQLEVERLQAQRIAAKQKQNQTLLIGGIVAVAIIVILLIVLNR